MFMSNNQIMMNIRGGVYKYLGSGSSRDVFDLNNGYVIKVAKNLAGIEQNRVEYYISASDEYNIFAKVVYAVGNFKYIIMEKAVPTKIIYVMKRFNVPNKREFLKLPIIKVLKEKYNLLPQDLVRGSSWGIIGNKLQIIDYGYTNDVKRRFY